MPERPIVVFNHIPKTAGTTLRFILTQNYSPDETLFLDNYGHMPMAEAAVADKETRKRIKLVYGHAGYYFARLYPGPVQLITFMREPYARLVSHYNYVRRVREDANHEAAMTLPFEQFVRECRLDDYHARQLVFPMSYEYIPPALERRGLLYRTALKHLTDKISFVGIVERFDQSVVMLRDLLKWERMPIYAPLMVNDQAWKKAFPEEVRERMNKGYLALGRALYDRALEMHEKRWEAGKARFEPELEKLHAQQRIVDGLLAERDLMFRQLLEARPRAEGARVA